MNNKIPLLRLNEYKKISNIARKKVNDILNINIKRITYKDLSDFSELNGDDLYGYTIINKNTKSIIILLDNIYKIELKEGKDAAKRLIVETIFHEARHLWQINNVFNKYNITIKDSNILWMIENDAYQFTYNNLNIINEILNRNN